MANFSSPKKPVVGWQRALVIWLDKRFYWLSRHWLFTFNLIIAFYVGLPIAAPVLMKVGASAPAKIIYTLYSPMCHQMTSRSFFLFGGQIAYPREIAGTSLTPLEAYLPSLPEFSGYSGDVADLNTFLTPARQFLGNEQMGYKMALCERDIAIYGMILIAGLIYGLVRRWSIVKPLPLWAFIIMGILPIALDGFSQLFAYYFVNLPTLNNLLPLRESTPFLRALTGSLFGVGLVWLSYPQIEPGMKDTEKQLESKLRRIGEL